MNGLTRNTNPWDDEADGAFFGLTATLFPASYTFGASVLLASYDPDDETRETPQPGWVDPEKRPITVVITTEGVVSWTRRSTS